MVFPKEATDTAVFAMVTKFHNFRSVCLASCSEVTDAVQALAEVCPDLEPVDLWRCSEVTEAGVQALAERLPGLKSVHGQSSGMK